MDIQKAIELCDSFYDDLRQCTKCKSNFNLDDVFVNIADICDATDEAINRYEKRHQVDLEDIWCIDCANKAIQEMEVN